MSSHALGIMVSADDLYAVLLEKGEEETVVEFKTSSAELQGEDADLPFEESGGVTPDMDEGSDDVTIQFGDEGAGGGDDMFMGSEFDDIGGGGEEEIGGESEPGTSWNFQAQLDELLDQCAERGYEDPPIAFCSTTSEVDRVELRLPADESADEDGEEGDHGLPLPASRSTLLEMLEEQYEGGVEDGRVGFVPMHRTGDGRQRVLALIARPGGPVLSTLETMQEQTLARSPRAQLLDTEVSLYLGLARSALQLPPDTPEKTILVRTGPDDTLVLFIEGNTLRQSEYLPELTAEDSAETICSRVLLLQDEYGMGEVQHLMLIAEDNEGVLSDAFKSYFAGANLRLLRTHLPNGEETESGAYVAATGAALRLLDDPNYEPFFQPVNLLAKRYTASPFRLPVGWSVPALMGLLAATTLGFVWYYFTNASAISERRSKLRTLEQQVQRVDQDALQRRIDSVQSAAATYAKANDVLNQLMRGSNKWSRGLATIAEQINRIEGLSIEQWSPEDETKVTVSGRSTDRAKVVRLAKQLDGEILTMEFTETRDVSLYDFQLTVPLDTTKPQAIDYWREQRGERLATVDELTQSQSGEGTSTTIDVPDDPSRRGGSNRSGGSPPDASGPEKSSSGAEWTVVVASLAEDAAAEEVAQRYRNRLGSSTHSVYVRRSPTNDRYRVAMGQFSSYNAAQSVLREMEETLPDDTWLLRTGNGSPTDSTAETSTPDEDQSPSSSSAPVWTVVVTSVKADSAAQRAAQSYRQRFSGTGHSVQVRESTRSNWYHVGVGTFSSFESAQSARREMKDILPPDAWLHKYSSPALTSGES